MDFSIIEKAGLRPIDFANILGVSRASVSFWMRGKCTPRENKHYSKKLVATLRALERWVQLGKLPKPDTPRAEIVKRIKLFVDNTD